MGILHVAKSMTSQERQHIAARNAEVVFRRALATLEAFQEIAGEVLSQEAAERFRERVKQINEEVW